MSRKSTSVSIHVAVCKLIAVMLLFTSTVPALAWSAPHMGDTPEKYPVYDMTPSSGSAGREYTVVVLKHDPADPKVNDETQLVPPREITVSPGVKATSNVSLTAKITIPKDTPIGKYRFLLTDKEGTGANTIGIADFDVTAIGQGPFPTPTPEVDVMWGVMPRAIVRHNFGHQVANNYYGIQIRIGNDSGFDLQIAGIGFKLPPSTGIKNIVPTNSYRATRGTLEREQEVGIRATVLNIAKSLGSLYSGFLPFWHMPNRRANANLAGEILTGPFEAGLEIVFPDTTNRQLTRLDDQTLRDGLVVKNNTQVVTLAWVPKKLLNLSKDAGKSDNDYPGRAKNTTEKDKVKDWSDDPQYVNWKLGELVLVGQQIAYINRVQVLKTSEGTGVTPPPSVTSTNPTSFKQGEEKDVVFIGTNLKDATLGPPPGIEIPLESISPDTTGTRVTAKIKIAETTAPGTYKITVGTSGGNIEVPFVVEAKSPDKPAPDPKPDTTDTKPATPDDKGDGSKPDSPKPKPEKAKKTNKPPQT